MTSRIEIVLAMLGASLAGAASVGVAEDTRIVVLPGAQISTDDSRSRHVESVLAVNPRDPDNLVAAAISFGEKRSGIAVYFSRDRGRSWGRATRSSDRQALSGGLDPALAFDPEGRAFFLSLTDEGIAVWASTDGGEHWAGPTRVGGSWDRPWIGSDGKGQLRLVGKLPITVMEHHAQDVIGLATSRDKGATFSFPALLLPAPEKHLLNAVSDLVLLPGDQALLVVQVYGPEIVGLRGRQPLTGSYSTLTLGDDMPMEVRPGPVFRTFGHGWEGKSAYGYGGARVAIDTSTSRWRGRLYMTFLDAVDGYFRVMASTSTDGGKTWSTPLRVTDATTTTDASNPAIAVNHEGVVGIVWNDRRADPTDRCYQPFFAASFDGGETFTANRRINDQLTCPIGPPPTAGGSRVVQTSEGDPIESDDRFKNGGDTQGIVGLPGSFCLAWINGGSGVMNLWSTIVEVKTPEMRKIE